MNIEQYTKKKIALFGKPRAFTIEILTSLLKQHHITLTNIYEDDVALIVEGAVLPTPLEEKIQELYKDPSIQVDFTDIDLFEKEVAKAIEPKKLLMSLKLANNQERIINYLKNDYISDSLFLELLKLYRYNDEDFFENDTNRDVTAAFIRRFYKEYETNHNIQYSNVGLVNTIESTQNPQLIETLFSLQPIQKALQTPQHPNNKIIKIIALHPLTNQKTLQKIIATNSIDYILYIASREEIPEMIQKALLALDHPEINSRLSCLKTLCKDAVNILLQKGYKQSIAQHITLNEIRFETLKHIPSIAQNPTLTLTMQKTLFQDPLYHEHLAKNFTCKLTQELFDTQNPTVQKLLYTHHDISNLKIETEGFELQLAQNPTTPPEILQKIYEDGIEQAYVYLAQNPSTPVDILYQLSFDFRYAKDIKQNPAFSQHIKTTHAIGIFK